MIATVSPPSDPQPRFDAALQCRMTIEQLQELRDVAADLGVETAVLVRLALRRGLDPARRAIAKGIAEAERGGASTDAR